MSTLIAGLDARLQALDARHQRRRRRTVEGACAPRVTVDGRSLLAFCSNDYLGLAGHPALRAALADGAARYGVGSGASHLISGHSRAHAALEAALAAWVAPHIADADALYFCTGYMANLGVITALAASADERGAEIFSESLNHASLIDGARLARGARISVYPHLDLADLDARLAASTAGTRIIVTDTVFSMDGDLAPLPALRDLARRHGAWLVVDDAHGFGVLGADGRGALSHFGIADDAEAPLVYVGTLGKAAGVGGAFVAAHRMVIDWLVQSARAYIYTTAAAPALAHALGISLALIGGAEGDARRAHLHALTARLQTRLALRRWRLLPSITPIQPIVVGDNAETLAASRALEAQGIWITAIRPPTVPAGAARLRLTLSAAHDEADVDRLVDALHAVERALDPAGLA